MTKPDKSLIYPLFIPMQGCPGRCIYCDQRKITGAPAFELGSAIQEVKAFIRRNPLREKEIAFYGGSFTALNFDLQEQILSGIAAVCDATTSVRISTHPRYIDSEILAHCKAHNVRTIELGIQDWDDAVLRASGRAYSSEDALTAVKLIQAAGFRLGLQLMPGLPQSSEQSIAYNHQILAEIKPDFLRLYPLVVIQGTPLAEAYLQGTYSPLSLKAAVQICADYAELCQAHQIKIIKYGIPSNIATAAVLAGPYHPAFGELVLQEILIRALQMQPERFAQLNAAQTQLLRAHGCQYLHAARHESCISLQGASHSEAQRTAP